MVENLPQKPKDSSLRALLKILKNNLDNPEFLRSNLPILRREIFTAQQIGDLAWVPDAYHMEAEIHEVLGEPDKADEFFEQSLKAFPENAFLGRGRTRRGQGRAQMRRGNLPRSKEYFEIALRLHAKDLDQAGTEEQERKGRRQSRITENDSRYALLQARKGSYSDRLMLVQFALNGCRDCHLREQARAVEMAIPYAYGRELQLLRLRQTEVALKRHKPVGAATAVVRLAIDTELIIAASVIRAILRKR